MDNHSKNLIPIAQLGPGLDSSASAIRGIVTVIWPYSASQQAIGLVLAEPDFRLRRNRGQVRVTFHGRTAAAVADVGVSSGDEVVISLDGVQWLDEKAQDRTPGRGIDWKLRFGRKISLTLKRDSAPPIVLDIDRASPTPQPEDITLLDAPAEDTEPPRPRPSNETGQSPVWQSPAFLSGRTYNLPFFSPFSIQDEEDPFEDGRSRKRTKFGRRSSEWRFAQTPSPTKGGSVVEQASISGDSFASGAFESKGHAEDGGTPEGRREAIVAESVTERQAPKPMESETLQHSELPPTNEVETTPPVEQAFTTYDIPDLLAESDFTKVPIPETEANPALGLQAPSSLFNTSQPAITDTEAPNFFQSSDLAISSFLRPFAPQATAVPLAVELPAFQDQHDAMPLGHAWAAPSSSSAITDAPADFQQYSNIPHDPVEPELTGFEASQSFVAEQSSESQQIVEKQQSLGEQRPLEAIEDAAGRDTAPLPSPPGSSAQFAKVGATALEPIEIIDIDSGSSSGDELPKDSTQLRDDRSDVSRESTDEEEDDEQRYSQLGSGAEDEISVGEDDEESADSGSEEDAEFVRVREPRHKFGTSSEDAESVGKEDEFEGMEAESPELGKTTGLVADQGRLFYKLRPGESAMTSDFAQEEGDVEREASEAESGEGSLGESSGESDEEVDEEQGEESDEKTKVQGASQLDNDLGGTSDHHVEDEELKNAEVAAPTSLSPPPKTPAGLVAGEALGFWPPFGSPKSAASIPKEESISAESNSPPTTSQQVAAPAATQKEVFQEVAEPQAQNEPRALENNKTAAPQNQAETQAGPITRLRDGRRPEAGQQGSISTVKESTKDDISDERSESGDVAEDELPRLPGVTPQGPEPSSGREKANADSPEMQLDTAQQIEQSLQESFNEGPVEAFGGFRTPLAYFDSLAAIPQCFNSVVDVFAVVVSSSRAQRARAGPRDHYLTLYLTDPSLGSSGPPTFIVAQVFRPSRNALPLCDLGEAVLLRNFKVQTQMQQFMLLSCDSSAWATFGDKGTAEIRGPPVELGDEEQRLGGGLRQWWNALNQEERTKIEDDVAISKRPGIAAGKAKAAESSAPATPERHVLRDGASYTDGPRPTVHRLRDGTRYSDP